MELFQNEATPWYVFVVYILAEAPTSTFLQSAVDLILPFISCHQYSYLTKGTGFSKACCFVTAVLAGRRAALPLTIT